MKVCVGRFLYPGAGKAKVTALRSDASCCQLPAATVNVGFSAAQWRQPRESRKACGQALEAVERCETEETGKARQGRQ